MEINWDEIEQQMDEIRGENARYLEIFEKDLANLSPKTIQRHVNNMDFFLNDYMLYEEPRRMPEGVIYVDDFLGYFFIRKCMWSTPASVKSTAASIKKFYKSMADHGFVEKEDYKHVCEVIKDNMEEWQDTCAQYNDPDADNPFNYFL